MKNTFTFIVLSFVWSFAFALQPSQQLNYYGKEFYTQISTLKDDQLRAAIATVLKSSHIKSANAPDQLTPNCAGQSSCVGSQVVLGYNGARKWMFGTYYLVTEASGKYGVHEKYCSRIYDGADFKKGNGPAPGVIPDGTVVNTEHTWPQSKFTGKYATEMQKSDLHHLFPTDSKQNSLRGNYTFGEVVGGERPSNCTASRFGNASNSHLDVFEPPTEHKGHVARALFYFATRYDMKISQPEEEILRKWNTEHPVDAEEITRNEEIFKIQGNRNPFIDYPELANSISDF